MISLPFAVPKATCMGKPKKLNSGTNMSKVLPMIAPNIPKKNPSIAKPIINRICCIITPYQES